MVIHSLKDQRDLSSNFLKGGKGNFRLLSYKKSRGFIALVTVLIISAIALLVGLSISSLSLTELSMSLQKNQFSEAYYLANLCAEQALMKLKEDSNYIGNETINMENGSCSILPIEGSWTIKISATSADQVKKMRIIISQINPEIVINSWSEVADF